LCCGKHIGRENWLMIGVTYFAISNVIVMLQPPPIASASDRPTASARPSAELLLQTARHCSLFSGICPIASKDRV